MFSVSRWIRLVGFLGLLVCAAAVAVGRMAAPDPTLRSMQPIRYASLSPLSYGKDDQRLSYVDLETGKGRIMALPDGERLSQVSWSPWRDESGSGQVVGFWRRHSGRNESEVASGIGLARYRFPEGTVLDRVSTDITPVGNPCWYPGTQARILFADGGGTLRRFAFEGSRDAGASREGCDARPWPILWKIHPPGEGERSVRMFDPVWPQGRAMEGRLIVSLSMQVSDGDHRRFTSPRLWWLQLDNKGEAIEAAGPLVKSDEPDGVRGRCPRVLKISEGDYRIAYLSRVAGASSWDVKVAPLAFDGEGVPFVRSGMETFQVSVAAPIAPSFSADGRWLYYLADPHEPNSIRRVAVPQVIASRVP